MPRGKRRIHAKPDTAEIVACSSGSTAEREEVKPGLLVLMGATAARAVLGRAVTIGRERGQRIAMADGQAAFVTVHPSFLLRLPDEESKRREYRAFVGDLTRLPRSPARVPRRRHELGPCVRSPATDCPRTRPRSRGS